jgi:lipoprotein-anchoring transpeptidase ErfK/SrfK
MKQINEELWSIVNTLKKEAEQAEDKTKALSVAVKALDRITALVELNNKISGRITNNHVTVNNSYLDMSTNLNVHLKKVFNDLTKRGVITVNKPEELPIL